MPRNIFNSKEPHQCPSQTEYNIQLIISSLKELQKDNQDIISRLDIISAGLQNVREATISSMDTLLKDFQTDNQDTDGMEALFNGFQKERQAIINGLEAFTTGLKGLPSYYK
jgi:hypothetical protein